MSRSRNDRGRRSKRNRKPGPSCGCWYCDEGRTKRRIILDRIMARELQQMRR